MTVWDRDSTQDSLVSKDLVGSGSPRLASWNTIAKRFGSRHDYQPRREVVISEILNIMLILVDICVLFGAHNETSTWKQLMCQSRSILPSRTCT